MDTFCRSDDCGRGRPRGAGGARAAVGGLDCDGDGYTGAAEANVFPLVTLRDQDACGVNAWPADFVSGGVPDSTDRVNVFEVTSFLAPDRRINTSPGDVPGYDVRWDIVPGAGPFSKVINVADVSSLVTVAPPMLNNLRAFNGSSCPWP